jgi:hypothetical protein
VFILAAATLIVLHSGEGGPVMIAPDAVVSLRGPAGDENKHFSKNVRCLLNLSDGKFVTVMETCDEVVRRLRE